jgi:Tfp pilus assembly protein PilV
VGFWRDERGITLAEVLVACAALGLVGAAVVMLHASAVQTYVIGSNKTEVQQNARVVLERMGREIRQSSGALTAATATSLTFVDQTTDVTTYALTGATLTRTANGVTQTVIGNIKSLTFAYWDGNNPPNALSAPVGTPANIRRVDITVQTGSEDTVVTGGVADTKAELTTTVRLRNLS